MVIDVTFAKIADFSNEYLGFTSSGLAALAVPEFFLLASWLFERFYTLRYGIAFILIFFGVQLLDPIFAVPPEIDCVVQISVVLCCILVAIILPLPSSAKRKDSDDVEGREESGAAGNMLAESQPVG